MKLKLISNTEELALIEIIFKDDLDKMSNEGFNGQERYIQCTKGNACVMTVFGENNKVLSSFEFGEYGSTLIPNRLRVLKNKALDFFVSERINVRNRNEHLETSFKTMPGHLSGLVNLHLGGQHAGHYSKRNIDKMLSPYQLDHTYIAETGIEVRVYDLI